MVLILLLINLEISMKNLSIKKDQTQIRFALTGATGFLGRNLLLEIIKQNYKNLSDIEIIILGRSSKEDSLHYRIMNILAEEVLDYIDDSNLEINDFLQAISSRIKCVNIALGEPNLGVSHDDFKVLSAKTIDFFFHVAALTDFRDGETVVKNLEKVNVSGTEELISLIANLKVSEFSYVSSAYACGLTHGTIMPDYVNLNQEFRNPYERTKLKAEIIVRQIKKKVVSSLEYFVHQQYVVG